MRHPWRLIAILSLPIISFLRGPRPPEGGGDGGRPRIFAPRPLPRWEGRDPTLSPKERRLASVPAKDVKLVLKLEAVVRVDGEDRWIPLGGLPVSVDAREGRLVLGLP